MLRSGLFLSSSFIKKKELHMEAVSNQITEYSTYALPQSPDSNVVYRLVPVNPDLSYYHERTDRNIGWITPEEQEILHSSVVGIAGAGGMGGLLAATLVRAGVGEVRISDTEAFDVSNINRQFGARRTSVGLSKAFETARLVREISNDTTIVVYPQGITEQTVNHFVQGCSVICDEIEVLAIDARILLHRKSVALDISLFNCNTVGFSTNLFLYTPQSITMEEMTGLSYEEAKRLRKLAEEGDSSAQLRIATVMMRAVVPELPEYRASEKEIDHAAFYRRLLEERKVPIIATNPPLATGFLANRVLLYLLRNSGIKRKIVATPEMPGYLHFDAAQMRVVVTTKGWL
jgi:molybdopterin/thiamine biosynthesis adenylyltransferase